MRRFTVTTVIALYTVLFVAICSAQQTPTTAIPNLIRYSGTLKDAQGAVPSLTTVGVTFAIYKEQDGGAPVWQETHNVTPDANGQYSIVLGSTTTPGLPNDLFAQQEQRWLGVQVQGQAEQARVLLVSVPYAFKAHEAETLGGLPASAFVKTPSSATGDVSIDAGTAMSNLNTAKADRTTASPKTTAATGTLPPGMLSLNGLDFWGDNLPAVRHDYTATSESLSNAAISNKIFIGGDNTNSTFPAIPFSTIQVGIATHTISSDSKLSIYDPTKPSVDVFGQIGPAALARGQLAVSTCTGCYSAIATAGDVVLRADADTAINSAFTGTKSLILSTRNNNSNAAIRFATGLTTETEKMTLLAGGNVGIAYNLPKNLFSVGAPYNSMVLKNSPFEVDSLGDLVRIRNIPYVWPATQGGSNTVLTNDGTGNLSWVAGGNVSVASPFCAGGSDVNYITKWVAGPNSVDCSHIYENPSTSSSPFFVGINLPTLPLAALDVNGGTTSGINTTDTRQSYMIGLTPVLSIFGSTNLLVGEGAGTNNTGDFNTFAGHYAGNANTMGRSNTYFGAFAGSNGGKAITVAANVFIGSGAGSDNVGGGNTFVGSSAGQLHAGGNSNTYLGTSTGIFATAGDSNTYAGFNAGGGASQFVPNTGSYNSFYGLYSGARNQLGSYNVFYGYLSGLNNTNGSSNIYLGNPGPVPVNESNAIRIGTEGLGNSLQQKNTYIAGIVSNPFPTGSNVLQVAIDPNGHLGTYTFGGGNVSGTCTLGANFLTKWVNTTGGVDCSHIYEDPSTSATPFYVGINVGANPLAALDVNGGSNSGINTTDTRQAYMIGTNPVLSIFPIANNNLFAGVGTGTNGNDNVFVGYNAGNNNGVMATTNTFVGSTSGENNGGTFNSFFGSGAGGGTVGVGANTGNNNVFVGNAAGQSNGSGARNTFVGNSAGTSNLGGNDNVYIGSLAGSANGGGQRNIDIGNPGVSGDFSTIRIGTVQSKTYIGGIYGSAAGNVNRTVCVDSTGKLWSTVSPASQCDGSSRRFKEQIIDMGDRSSKLLALRPVTFLYKPEYDDGLHSLQYGLIAEEVAKVYPDLVEYEKDGQVRTVKYQMLAPMLLNEVQKQHTVVTAQQALVKAQQEQIQTQAQQIQDLQERLLRMESLLENK